MNEPYQVWSVLDGEKGHLAGFTEKNQAEHRMEQANKGAIELGIKTRYILIEAPVSVVPVVPIISVPEPTV